MVQPHFLPWEGNQRRPGKSSTHGCGRRIILRFGGGELSITVSNLEITKTCVRHEEEMVILVAFFVSVSKIWLVNEFFYTLFFNLVLVDNFQADVVGFLSW